VAERHAATARRSRSGRRSSPAALTLTRVSFWCDDGHRVSKLVQNQLTRVNSSTRANGLPESLLFARVQAICLGSRHLTPVNRNTFRAYVVPEYLNGTATQV